MIFRRAVAKLRAQDRLAIFIEVGIVILGVFIGTWVANWNAARLSQRQTRETLIQLLPELKQLNAFSASARRYYAITDAYGRVALKGWARDPSVSDSDFVIAAYQASQIYGFNNNGASWSLVFGADQLRNIDDPAIRRPLTRLMTFDYLNLNLSAVKTPYRDQVRQYIPDEIQGAIRDSCGDRNDRLGTHDDVGFPLSVAPRPGAGGASGHRTSRSPGARPPARAASRDGLGIPDQPRPLRRAGTSA